MVLFVRDEVLGHKSSIMRLKCYVPPRTFALNNITNPISSSDRYLDLHHLFTFNLSKQALQQIIRAKQTGSMPSHYIMLNYGRLLHCQCLTTPESLLV